MKTDTKDALVVGGMALVCAAGTIACVVGWVLNLYRLAEMNGFSGLLVLRVIGIFMAPVGVVLGYMP